MTFPGLRFENLCHGCAVGCAQQEVFQTESATANQLQAATYRCVGELRDVIYDARGDQAVAEGELLYPPRLALAAINTAVRRQLVVEANAILKARDEQEWSGEDVPL